MWFDDKKVSDITADELLSIVDNATPEDGMIEFKRETYPNPKTKEFLRDVVAFANASGGYILIGVDEDNHRAYAFSNVPDATREAGRLRDCCLQSIEPRIRDLEILPRRVKDDTEIIVVRIPESGIRPHMVALNDDTYFCRRYQDRKRSMSIDELQAAFVARASASPFGITPDMGAKVDELLRIERGKRLERLDATQPIRDAEDMKEVRRIMDLRFRRHIGDNPYFRITCTPVDISATDLKSNAEQVRELLREPPQTRHGGWTIWPAKDVKTTREGWLALGVNDRQLTLLTNGHIEYWQPCNDSMFQWGRQSHPSETPELFPFAVCELPVNFTRLAKEIVNLSGSAANLVFHIEYANIKGFTLRPGVPDSIVYMMPAPWVTVRGYEHNDLSTDDVQVGPGFDPDPVAFELVKDVYAAFDIPRKYIPWFTKEGQFDTSANGLAE